MGKVPGKGKFGVVFVTCEKLIVGYVSDVINEDHRFRVVGVAHDRKGAKLACRRPGVHVVFITCVSKVRTPHKASEWKRNGCVPGSQRGCGRQSETAA